MVLEDLQGTRSIRAPRLRVLLVGLGSAACLFTPFTHLRSAILLGCSPTDSAAIAVRYAGCSSRLLRPRAGAGSMLPLAESRPPAVALALFLRGHGVILLLAARLLPGFRKRSRELTTWVMASHVVVSSRLRVSGGRLASSTPSPLCIIVGTILQPPRRVGRHHPIPLRPSSVSGVARLRAGAPP